jgi:hypothetical protein
MGDLACERPTLKERSPEARARIERTLSVGLYDR